MKPSNPPAAVVCSDCGRERMVKWPDKRQTKCRPCATKAKANMRTATQLANAIKEHWHGEGYTEVEVWIEPGEVLTADGTSTGPVIRSNLVNGRAPSQVGRAA